MQEYTINACTNTMMVIDVNIPPLYLFTDKTVQCTQIWNQSVFLF